LIRIEGDFDLLGIETPSIPLNPYGLGYNRTSPYAVPCLHGWLSLSLLSFLELLSLSLLLTASGSCLVPRHDPVPSLPVGRVRRSYLDGTSVHGILQLDFLFPLAFVCGIVSSVMVEYIFCFLVWIRVTSRSLLDR
jgi:hypothetical protein